VLLQRLDHLQPGEDTEIPVEASAGGDRVDVRPGHHGSRSRIGAGTGGDDISEGVDHDLESEVTRPADDEIPPLTIGVGEGQPAAALLAVRPLDGAELAEFDEAVPQPSTVDPQVLPSIHHARSSHRDHT
jgi:hypothetical protein